jgi:hypothetical protein
MRYASLLERIHRDVRACQQTLMVTDDMLELARVFSDRFGMAIVSATGAIFRSCSRRRCALAAPPVATTDSRSFKLCFHSTSKAGVI